MYGVGARLDNQPELLFLLRGVDHQELVSQAIAAGNLDRELSRGSGGLGSQDLGAIFGIELDSSVVESAKPEKKQRTSKKVVAATAAVAVTPTKEKVKPRKTGVKNAIAKVPPEVLKAIGRGVTASKAGKTDSKKAAAPPVLVKTSVAKAGLAKAKAASKKSAEKALIKSAKKKTGAATKNAKRSGHS